MGMSSTASGEFCTGSSPPFSEHTLWGQTLRGGPNRGEQALATEHLYGIGRASSAAYTQQVRIKYHRNS